MVVIYALCWLPLHCVTVLGDLQPSIWQFKYIQLVWIACHWLSVSSCCWNPIVYYWMNDTLRAGFAYAVGSWCPCVRRSDTVPTTACRRHVGYQSSLRDSEHHHVDGERGRTGTFARHPSSSLYYRVRVANVGRTNNMELRRLRASTSGAYSSPASPVRRVAPRSC